MFTVQVDIIFGAGNGSQYISQQFAYFTPADVFIGIVAIVSSHDTAVECPLPVWFNF